MKILGIDEKKCSGCGECSSECPAHLFTSGIDRLMRFSDPNRWCIGCGHCIAVCPEDAVRYEADEKAAEYAGALPGIDATLDLLRTKRSVRRYTTDTVPRSDIETVLTAMRHAPSGHNAQPCEYAVITDNEIKRMMRECTIGFLKRFRRMMRFHLLFRPFIAESLYKVMTDKSTALGIDDMTQRFGAGEDPIFFDAPVVVAAHVPDMGGESFIDPAVSLTYGMLAAHALGLGSCWMGFAVMAVKKNRDILDRLSIPKERMIAGVMTLGYPVSRYHRVPVRNGLKVTWI
jgi:nitroreductase/NAD-dependent dihydropyrimidine dehydrogenase PreA subunit